MYEFQVDSVNESGLVLGRNVGKDIPAGTSLTAIHRWRYHGEGSNVWSENAEAVGNVALMVREVHLYGHVTDVVPGGYTAGLVVSGDGLEILTGALRNLPRNEYLSLVADE